MKKKNELNESKKIKKVMEATGLLRNRINERDIASRNSIKELKLVSGVTYKLAEIVDPEDEKDTAFALMTSDKKEWINSRSDIKFGSSPADPQVFSGSKVPNNIKFIRWV